jgi:iron complex transport system substrate-binding protein
MERSLLAVALLFPVAYAHAADIPRRIVSLSPDLTEIIYGLGALDRVVGVSNYDTYPPEAVAKPHLGQLHSANLELLTGLRPDLVIINTAQAPFLEDTLKSLGFRTLKTSNRTIAEVYEAMMTIGRAIGREKEAAALVATTREGIDRVARRVAAITKPGAAKPRIAMIVDRTPGTLRDLYAATKGTYLAELIEIAGGQMALPPVPTGYEQLRHEDLLAANPDIILDFIQGPQSRFAGNPIEAWQEMPELKAVRTKRVYGVNEDYVPHASQRLVLTVELFARLIHPEIK